MKILRTASLGSNVTGSYKKESSEKNVSTGHITWIVDRLGVHKAF